MTDQLRRSEILGKSISLLRSWGRLVGSCYKHPAPTEQNGLQLCGILYFRVWQHGVSATH